MQLCKVRLGDGTIRVGWVTGQQVHLPEPGESGRQPTLSDILHGDHAEEAIQEFRGRPGSSFSDQDLTFLPPIDGQEVWAAGVTYKRSQEARERESAGAAGFYDLVYSAPRPELFFKATPQRVAGHNDPVHIRRDSRWSVPEPELALVLSPGLRVVGYTIGNDVSARDIEGENPLYLPQAKVYDRSCALGPFITPAGQMPPLSQVRIGLTIERGGAPVFRGSTGISEMARPLEELVHWLGRETSFPSGVVLLTGTGIIPPDDFALAPGDRVHIDITGIGRLTNYVRQAGELSGEARPL